MVEENNVPPPPDSIPSNENPEISPRRAALERSSQNNISIVIDGLDDIEESEIARTIITNNDRRRREKPSNEMINEMPAIMDKRDMQLDNLIGNYLIALAQVDKIRDMIIGRAYNQTVHTRNKDGTRSNKSVHEFYHNGKWYRITNMVEEISAPYQIIPNKPLEDLK